MRHWPLNRTRPFRTWPHFDPGAYLDMNPTFVRIGGQPGDEAAGGGGDVQDWVIFCRYGVPPRPGYASIWAVRVDGDLNPAGRPLLLIGNGTDPRAVMSGGKLIVFYALIEMEDGLRPIGSTMALAEFKPSPNGFESGRAFALPKRPIEGRQPADWHSAWEKNWVPFPLGDDRIGLIYAHEPWDVITLDVSGDLPRLDQFFSSPAIDWDYGTIRGGTPPIAFDDDHLITFFHSSQVIGNRNVYSVGACVFAARAPYAPVLMTPEPLLIARYASGAARFDWQFAGSVIFPLGAKTRADGFSLVSGLDDGEIGIFDIDRGELDGRLAAPTRVFVGTLYNYRGDAGARVPARRFLVVPDTMPGLPSLRMLNFLKILAGGGRTFVDVGAHVGFFAMGLAPQFDRVLAFEPSRSQFAWLERNRVLNGYGHVACEPFALGNRTGGATLRGFGGGGPRDTLASEGADHAVNTHAVGVERLDDRALGDVDLLKIDVAGSELAVLEGATETIGRSRPPILIEVGTDPEQRQKVGAFMRLIDYGFESMFPLSPELVMCFPQERRGDYDWFVENPAGR